MTDEEIYKAYCVGCLNERSCHEDCTECDFVTALKAGVCPVCGNGKIVAGKCTACGITVDDEVPQ